MSYASILLSFLVVVASANAQAPEITPPEKVTVIAGTFHKIDLKLVNVASILWNCDELDGLAFVPEEYSKSPIDGVVFGAKEGTYTVKAVASSPTGKQKRFKVVIEVVGARPPPKKIEPKEEPKVEPKEVPTPNSEKIPAGFMSITIIEETADAADKRGEYFTNEELVKYIQTNAYKGKINNFDKDARATDPEAKKIRDYYLNEAKKGGSLPWLVIVNLKNNKKVHSGPLPKEPEELLTLLKTFGS